MVFNAKCTSVDPHTWELTYSYMATLHYADHNMLPVAGTPHKRTVRRTTKKKKNARAFCIRHGLPLPPELDRRKVTR